MPNTILMQDLTRLAFDRYLEEDETRKPVLISLKKGTLLPAPLIAFSFDPSKFSLQSLHPLELSKLNSVLDELYSTEATIFDAEEWFDQNPFHDAGPDVYDL
ncbi:hypothetical protein AYO21_11083 [Fonsecaea monophora]|uniref:Tse2 ADP-ribosyltransferase toxin domain-containing protein n=1 Tax=Fonsecaea monophora TaxID=254056 RepID=A0A177ERV0_9EURO|nr:hypothetical protein AYO21_11083 [Fonsecaea monophora]OAG34735.1 hypothetical protein AYO21_11083 [Fonsecaea monophora]